MLLRGCDACRAVCGGLQLGAALIDVLLDVWSLPPSSSSQTVAGCLLGEFPVGRDQWGGDRIVGGVLPRISHQEKVLHVDMDISCQHGILKKMPC